MPSEKSIYKTLGFIRVSAGVIISSLHEIFRRPLIYSPALDRIVEYLHAHLSLMRFLSLATWQSIFQFAFTMLVIWAIFRLVGIRASLIIGMSVVLIIGIILGSQIGTTALVI